MYQFISYYSQANTTNGEAKRIQTFKLSGKIGQKVWDVRALKSGTYLYTFVASSTTKSGKIVIK